MKKLISNIPPIWMLVLGVLLATGLVWQATSWVYNDALNKLTKVGEERLTLYSGTLHEALSRYAYIPYVLSQNANVKILLKTTFNQNLVNQYLRSLNSEAGSEALYVMNAIGDTLAASNWQEPLSFVGKNYGFRPYFTDAKAGRKGQFFAIGVTTGQPGYFMSHPVLEGGRFLGATVVKVDLSPLQDDWREGGETVLVSDANGVLFLSSREDWKYRTLTQLSENQRTLILAGRQYGAQSLDLLPLETVESLPAGQKIVRFDNVLYLLLSRPLKDLNWQIHHVVPLASVEEQGQAVLIIGIVLTLLLLALSLYARERRQKQISRRKAHQAEAIQEMNLRLQEEIAEKKRTESALRETQAELVQAGKLAALGHMAAGIVHELNQPISAIRTQAASGHLLLNRDETGKVRETLSAINRMTEHMASITSQLKTFAHKTPKLKEQVVLQDCLDGALVMTADLFKDFDISLFKDVPSLPVILNGDRVRIKQVLVNLIRNAVDAMKNCERRDLRIRISPSQQEVEVSLSDSGTGIAEGDLEELFTPFFTTKEVGEGLGLGLSISYRTITDLGGTIRVKNLSEGGAQFTIRLPLVRKWTEQQDD
ncbi:MAG: ATP-binding protein [Desulfuromusa sp.]|jgi:two-component system C4-dicarboxylate transport sensor histidine kinase DctB|nr:ATP-binding protein [Desulfuromusa sp.]